MDKQNFDLKLEIFHRRERNDVLEKKVQELEGVETSLEELHAMYETLLLDYEKQQLVLDDAVAHICDLEVENEDLQAAVEDQRTSVWELERSGRRQSKQTSISTQPSWKQSLPETPDMNGMKLGRAHPRNLRNLSGNSPSTARNSSNGATLRADQKGPGSENFTASAESLKEENPSTSSLDRPQSLLSDEEDDDYPERHFLNSPRLSILSESGFSSIYGGIKEENSTPGPAVASNLSSTTSKRSEASRSQWSMRREARIDEWMQEDPRPSTPPQQTLNSKPSDHFTSIGSMLQKIQSAPDSSQPEHPRHKERHARSPTKGKKIDARQEPISPPKPLAIQKRSYSSSMARSNLGGRLPPTPDTMSTATIGGNSSSQSIITERSLADQTHPPSKTFSAMVSYGRPGTSDTIDSQGTTGPVDSHSGSEMLEPGDEAQSTRVEQSDNGIRLTDLGVTNASPFLGGSIHPDRMFGTDAKTKASKSPGTTDLMFNGEGYALVQPPRTILYPSQQNAQRDLSKMSPTGHKTSGLGEKTAPLSPSKQASSRENVMTPTKLGLKDGSVLSPTRSVGFSNPPEQLDSYRSATEQELISQRAAPGRLRLFRRSNSHNSSAIAQNAETTLPVKRKEGRSNSSTRAQRRPSTSESNSHGKKMSTRATKGH